MRSRTVKRPGPLLHQQRLHSVVSARRRDEQQLRYWDAMTNCAPSADLVARADFETAGEVTWVFPESQTHSPEDQASAPGLEV